MDVNQKYCQSCHLISQNGFIIRKIMSSQTHGLKILESNKNLYNQLSPLILLGTRKTGQMCDSVVKISKPYLSYS
jgi:hypothetical protein